MNQISKIVIFVSCVYLLLAAARLPQLAFVDNGKRPALSVVVIMGLSAFGLLAAGIYLRLIFP
jgi:hypothetical protein